jgi:prostamide/prostaglandin F2alpha synthase
MLILQVLTYFHEIVTIIIYFHRQGAKELSRLTPILDPYCIKNIGVGLEDFGLEEFVEGNFFTGDLYVDIEKKTFKGM